MAVVMDGNGRWAQSKGMSRIEGHKAGAESVRVITTAARELGIEALTLFAFSTENWNRPRLEVNALMSLLGRYLKSELSQLLENDIKLNVIGDNSRLPKPLQKLVKETMDQTAENKSMVFSIALSYSGRDDIVQAAQSLGREIKAGNIEPDEINEELFSNSLYSAGLPEPDLLIRTSGEYRISNFFLWQLAYTEMYFSQTFWPDFREEEFHEIILDYQRRERRFGKTDAQVKGKNKD